MSLNPELGTTVTTVSPEKSVNSRLVVALENPNDPREDSLNAFISGINIFRSVAKRVAETIHDESFYTDISLIRSLIGLKDTMSHLGVIISLQSSDTREAVSPEKIGLTQAYLAQLTGKNAEDIDLHKHNGITEAANILILMVQDMQASIESARIEGGDERKVHMNSTDVATLSTIYEIITHDLGNPLSAILSSYQRYARQKEKGKNVDELKTPIDNVWKRLFVGAETVLGLVEDPYIQNRRTSKSWKKTIEEILIPWIGKSVKMQDVEIGEREVSWLTEWAASFVNNCLSNADRAGSTRAEVIVGENDKCFYVEIKDYGDGFDDKMLKCGFDGSHGYSRKRRRSNKESKGIAMRVLSKMAEAYGGEVSLGNWYDNDNKKHGLVRLELPFAEETLEELAEEAN